MGSVIKKRRKADGEEAPQGCCARESSAATSSRPVRSTAMTRTVLVTGVSRYLGGQMASRLAADPDVDSVIGVDVVAPPEPIEGIEFVQADSSKPHHREGDGGGVGRHRRAHGGHRDPEA
ncbi:MAG: hypothetical protein U0R65_02655 [Candidatus Nanopelagicales bacterium]